MEDGLPHRSHDCFDQQNFPAGMTIFTDQSPNAILGPLQLSDSCLSDLALNLSAYELILEEDHSLAIGRGANLASTRLAKSLQSMFTSQNPCAVQGPPLPWTTVVIAAGPEFKGPAQLTIGESCVNLPEDDLELICSGRPWRFLCPWPDQNDCKKELEASEMALGELRETQSVLNQSRSL